MQYFGKVELGAIENQINTVISSNQSTPINELKAENIKYVFYPDCQQLIIWLPNPGSHYNEFKIHNLDHGQVILSDKVQNIINGSIQIILDSSNFSPASYCLELDWPKTIKHLLFFKKLEPGVSPKEEDVLPDLEPPKSESLSDRRRYYDSFGNLVPDDIDFRNLKMDELLKKLNRKIEYKDDGRTGTIYYIDGETKIGFNYEFGGANCIVFINVPTEEKWESQTGVPLDQRKEIIEFIASRVHQEKVASSRIEISSDAISFYSK